MTPSIAAASSTGVFPFAVLAGEAGSAPGTRPRGSDQVACQKPNGTGWIADPIALRSAAVTGTILPSTNVAWALSEVPDATDRSCRTACGSPCPANTASAAPTAAATSAVSAAAARTTQCAVARRAASGPRGPITEDRIA